MFNAFQKPTMGRESKVRGPGLANSHFTSRGRVPCAGGCTGTRPPCGLTRPSCTRRGPSPSGETGPRSFCIPGIRVDRFAPWLWKLLAAFRVIFRIFDSICHETVGVGNNKTGTLIDSIRRCSCGVAFGTKFEMYQHKKAGHPPVK